MVNPALTTVLDALPVGTFVCDNSGGVRFANRAAHDLLGLAPSACIGRGWLAALHPETREKAAKTWYGVDASVRPNHAHLDVGLDPLGMPLRSITVNVEWIADVGDGVPGYLGTLTDTTDLHATATALRESERQHRLISANLPGSVVAVIGPDLTIAVLAGELVDAAVTPLNLVGARASALATPGTGTALEAACAQALQGVDCTVEFDSDHLGSTVEVHLGPYRAEHGTILGVLLVGVDVTSQRLADAALRHAERRFRAIFEEAPIGMAVVGLDGSFRRTNEALIELTGYTRADLEATSLGVITHPDDVASGAEQLATLASGASELEAAELRFVDAGGRPVWVAVHASLVRDGKDEPDFLVVQIEDITERRRFEDRLRHMADHDPLTGLPNRRAFEAALTSHVDQIRRYGADGALLVLDLDGFKYVNDTLGHAAGDELLISVASVLRERLRTTDVLARLGGDEFAVLLPHGGRDETWNVAQALVEAIRTRADRLEGELAGRVTASVGVAVFGDTEVTADEALVNADLAMYDAKESGRNRVCFFDGTGKDESKIRSQMAWVEKIGHAIDEDRFALWAQPIVDLQKMETSWHELLIRMIDEDGQVVSPADFLPVAERFDLIQTLDLLVARKAVALLEREGRNGRRLPVSINISGRSVGDIGLLEVIEEDIARAKHVNASDLILEVTETAAVSDIPAARRFSERLSEIGCRLALDDFGAGFGSFYYLKHLPFDILKIDGEFIRGCASNPTDRLVIRALVDIARGMDKVTVGEFVGDDETVRLLLRDGVDLGQGYHLGMPRPVEELLGHDEVSPRSGTISTPLQPDKPYNA